MKHLKHLIILLIFSFSTLSTFGCIDKRIPDQDIINVTYNTTTPNTLVQVRTDLSKVEWYVDDISKGIKEVHDGGFSEYYIGNLSVGTHIVKADDTATSVQWTVNVMQQSTEQHKENNVTNQYDYPSWKEQNRIANEKKKTHSE